MLDKTDLNNASLLLLRVIEAFIKKHGQFPSPIDLCPGDTKVRWSGWSDVMKDYNRLRRAGWIEREEGAVWSKASITPLGYEWLASNVVTTPTTAAEAIVTPGHKVKKLKGKKAEVLRFIVEYVAAHGGIFPNPVEIAKTLNKKVSSWSRSHILGDLRWLEAKGLVARREKTTHAHWSKHGIVTSAGHLSYAALPKKAAAGSWSRGPRRTGGGLHADGGTKFKNMLIPAERLGSGMVQLADRFSKLGYRVKKGRGNSRQMGLRMATFSLEEGRTCSPTCGLRSTCYAGKMAQQKRILYEGAKTGRALAKEIYAAEKMHYRINTVGDIPDEDFLVAVWAAIGVSGSTAWGYTHWQPEHPLGENIRNLSDWHWDFFAIRTSYEHGSREPLQERAAVVMKKFDPKLLQLHNAIACPQQTGQAKNCAECGYCYTSRRNVAFEHH